MDWFKLFFITFFSLTSGEKWNTDVDWSKEGPGGSVTGKLAALDVICGKDHMTVRAEFNGPFQGIIFSKGTYGQDNCVYVKPYSGLSHATFKVYYDACGTKPDLKGKYYENTIVIQYGTDIIEAWDEAKRLRCEWFEAYEKPATFRPAIPVADLDVVEMNFQGDDIDCWMEIQDGKGPWSREINRIVPVGQLMTIVVAINDYNSQFDMRVKSCFAHDGVKPPIQLTDEIGCVLRPKMLTQFMKVRDPNGRATVISYSYFYAFKFPDTMNVQIQCTVEVCRHGCPEACTNEKYKSIPKETKLSVGSTDGSRNDDLGGSESRDPLPIPGIPDINVAKHAAFLLRNQGVQDDQIKNAVYRQNTSKIEYLDERDHVASESKPVVKVLDIDVPGNSKQKVTITEQNPANLLPEDIRHASKFLSDLGLNVDLGSLANDFMGNIGSREVSELLKNDKVREFALASGLNLNTQQPHHHYPEPVPSAEALISEMPEAGTTNSPLLDEELENMPSSFEHHPAPDQANRTGLRRPEGMDHTLHKHPHAPPSSSPAGQMGLRRQPLHQQQQQQHQQHQQQHPPRPAPVYRPGPGQVPPGLHQVHNQHQEPVVQVFEIPLRPGLRPPTNSIQGGGHNLNNRFPFPHRTGAGSGASSHPPHPSPGSSSHPSHHFGIPFLQGGLEALRRHIRLPGSRPSGLSGILGQGQGLPRPSFPHGPRSMRLRRSAGKGSEVRVHKRFQVVTSIDLSFSPNATDMEAILEGRRGSVLDGICMARTPLIVALSTLFSVILVVVIFSASLMYRIIKHRSSNKC